MSPTTTTRTRSATLTPEPGPLDLFEATSGLRYWSHGESYTITSGQYGTGEGALVVIAGSGEPEGKITVCLAPPEGADAATKALLTLRNDELFVKWMGDLGVTSGNRMWKAISGLGIFEDTGERVDAGYVIHYAARWCFARCAHDEYVVRCASCRAAIDLRHETARERYLARDAVNRLGGTDHRSPRATVVTGSGAQIHPHRSARPRKGR